MSNKFGDSVFVFLVLLFVQPLEAIAQHRVTKGKLLDGNASTTVLGKNTMHIGSEDSEVSVVWDNFDTKQKYGRICVPLRFASVSGRRVAERVRIC